MKLTIPLTGTVIQEGSIFGDGKLEGDPNDPIRPIDINLGNVSWKMINVDIENEEMEIEVSPAEQISADTGQVDGEGEPIFRTRKTTQQEKAGFLQHAKDLIEGHTKDELYALANRPKLKRPFKEEK